MRDKKQSLVEDDHIIYRRYFPEMVEMDNGQFQM